MTGPYGTASQPNSAPGKRHFREGAELTDQSGYFKMSGDRLTFFTSDGKVSLVGLENLNLQRIAKTIADSPGQLEWKVSGTITEFSGANFLLVERAIRKSQMESGGVR